jgi:allantoate deiminase
MQGPALSTVATGLSSGGGRRAVERCRLLTRPPFSETVDGLTRRYLSPAHLSTSAQIAEWMKDAGMAVRIDPAGNLIGRHDGLTDAPILLIGSHIDSVRDAGAFDGPLGVMLGIECVAALAGRKLPFAVEVIAFGDEEGSRFPASMLTSRAAAGTLDIAALDMVDSAGTTLEAALVEAGLTRAAFAGAPYTPGSVRAYLEPHIEQGPVLEAENLAIGVVTAIAGQRRLAVTMSGTPGHAGTNSMELRRDALTAAAEAILAIEAIARAGKPDLVATVGRLAVLPGATNVVPGRVEFTVDIRSGSDAERDTATAEILTALDTVAVARGIGLAIEETQALAASPCDPDLTDRLAVSVVAIGQEARRLVSGAGHDAMVMADLCPTTMLFIRCAGGVSHNPAEDVMVDDVEQALLAMTHFVEGLAA